MTRQTLAFSALFMLTVVSPVAVGVTGAAAPDGMGANISRGFRGTAEEPSFAEPSFAPTKQSPEKQVPSRVLPPVAIDKSAAAARYDVAEIQVTGNTVLAQAQIDQTIAPYRHRSLNTYQIEELRKRLSRLYFDAGYINSGVVVPNNAVTDGDLTLQAIEGRLRDIRISGNTRTSSDYIERRLRSRDQHPLNIAQLQTSLRLLEADAVIDYLNGTLVPRPQLGEADLLLDIKEAKPLRVRFGFDNHRSPSVGSSRGLVDIEHVNLTGRGDRLAIGASVSQGVEDGYVAYQLPLNSRNTTLSLQYQQGQSEVVETPFDDLDIESDTKSWRVAVTHPLMVGLRRQLSVTLGLDHSASETELLGRAFSFSAGARGGRSASTNTNLAIEWIQRGAQQVFAARTTLRYGLDAFGSTTIPNGAPTRQLDTRAAVPESKFRALLVQAQYIRRLALLDSQLATSIVWQRAFDPLLAVDQYAVGGIRSVRGFRENQFVRDNGLSASLEWRIPLATRNLGQVTLAPFFDYGRSWDTDSRLSSHTAASISSVGIALRWQPLPGLTVNAAIAERLDDDDVPQAGEHDLQDDGVHLAITYQFSF